MEAVIVELPAATVVAEPELSIVAMLPSDELQVALSEMSWELPSLKLPMAMNCCVDPTGTEGLAGVTTIDEMTAGVTVVDAAALIEPTVAVIVTEPVATVLTTPLLSTVAIVVSEDAQVTESTCVLPSVNSPVAVIWVVVPRANKGFAGDRVIETSAAGSTVNVVEPVTEPEVADIVVLPVATPVPRPVLSIVATLLSDEAHETFASCCEVPSLNIPVATKV